MNLKVIILILNVLYIIATIIWAIIDKSLESIVAIIGGLISFATYYIANNNSFSVTIGRNIKVDGDYYENNYS